MPVLENQKTVVPPIVHIMRSSQHAVTYLEQIAARNIQTSRTQIIPIYRNGEILGVKLILNFESAEHRETALLSPPDESLTLKQMQ